MVSGERFVLKDLSFYKEVHETDSKACKERLDQQEEKMQEGKLRRASDEKGRVSSSLVCPPTKKKKKLSVKVTKASTPVPASPSTSTPTTSDLADSSVQASEGNSDSSGLEPSDSGARSFEPKSELIALIVINESEAEKNTSIDLRASFKERYHKRLHEAIDVIPPPAKGLAWRGLRRSL